jgi:LPS-assembly protein
MVPGFALALDPELQLKVERQLRMAPTRPERDSAKFLEADRIEGQPEKNIVATGNVTLRQRGSTIRADRVEYSAADQVATATGSVVLERGGDTATGPTLRYDLAQDTGVMDAPVFEFPKTGERRTASRGEAARAILAENRVSHLEQAEYTSCPAPRDDWFIRVREMTLDGIENSGTAYNTTVYFLGLPILYSPYLSFPLDNKRRSGFLAPTIGTSGQSGFEFGVPY